MGFEPNEQNADITRGFVVVGSPKRKNPSKRLSLCTRRYSRKRAGRRRYKQLRAWKAHHAALRAAEEAAAQNPAPSSATNEQQCDDEIKVENGETEEDFAASISVVFNVLDGTYTIKDDNDRNRQLICLSSQGYDDAFDGVNAETPTRGSSQPEEMQCEKLKAALLKGKHCSVKKAENFEELGCKKLEADSNTDDYYVMEKVGNFEELDCKKRKSDSNTEDYYGVKKEDNLKELGCKKMKTESNPEGYCGTKKEDNLEELGCKELETESDTQDYFILEKTPKVVKKEPFRSDKLCIVDMGYVFEQIKAAGDHSKKLDCSTKHLEITNIRSTGMMNTLIATCSMCHYKADIHSIRSDSSGINIHHGAVIGTLSTGGGFAQLEQFLAALNVSAMTMNTYSIYHNYVVEALVKAAEIEMVAAAEEEKKLAIERGDVLPSGIPFIPVIADGSWMKRSYGTGKFDSPAGCGVIIGYYSKKVLFIGVRNKNCSVCHYAEKNKTPPRDHKCYKNWGNNEPSTKMESDAILEGFQTSLATRGLIYGTLIADGDSSSYRRILDSDPYAGMMRVSKIECTNHLLRNFCKKMREIVKKTPRSKYKKTIEASITKMRTAIGCAAKFRRTEDVPPSQQLENLKMDIMNVPSHIFGEHKECRKIGYFCDGVTKKNEVNIVPELIKLGVYDRIQEILGPLLNHGQSLLLNRTNNLVESFNAIVAKYIGAKRLNFSQRGSYLARCSAAVVQFNTKELISRLYKVMNREPTSVIRAMEMRNKRMTDLKKARITAAAAPRHVRKLIFPEDDPDYGPNALQPDVEQLPEFAVEVESETGGSQSYSQSQAYSQSQTYPQSQTLTECVDDTEEDSGVAFLSMDSQNIYYQIETAEEESDMFESQLYSQNESFTECVADAEEDSAVAVPMNSQNICYQLQIAEDSEMYESESCSQSDMFAE